MNAVHQSQYVMSQACHVNSWGRVNNEIVVDKNLISCHSTQITHTIEKFNSNFSKTSYNKKSAALNAYTFQFVIIICILNTACWGARQIAMIGFSLVHFCHSEAC